MAKTIHFLPSDFVQLRLLAVRISHAIISVLKVSNFVKNTLTTLYYFYPEAEFRNPDSSTFRRYLP